MLVAGDNFSIMNKNNLSDAPTLDNFIQKILHESVLFAKIKKMVGSQNQKYMQKIQHLFAQQMIIIFI
jgi:hypothetical protein